MKLGKRNAIAAIVIMIAFSLILWSFFYLNPQNPFAGNMESITIGLFPNELNSLIYIADSQQYFALQGFKVTIKDYSTVLTAVSGMLNGDVDISTASEFVLVGNALTEEGVRAFATIDKLDQVSIIGRKDRGIESISNLAGKRIGVFKGAVAEFYLGRFLELNGMSLSEVTVVDLSLNVVDALTEGSVDAVITGQPNIDRIENVLGEEVTVLPAQSGQSSYYSTLCTDSWAAANKELITRFLNSLSQAESYAVNNPDKTKTLIQTRLNYSAQYMAKVWSDHQFSLSLDQSFILAMEDESRWLINNKLTNATVVPNFLNYVYVDGLETVKPNSVSVIR